MPAVQELCQSYGIDTQMLSRSENLYLEVNIFTHVCDELKEIFRHRNKGYFQLMKYTLIMENEMLDNNFMRLILIDILSSDEYNISGVAQYTGAPEEVIHEIALGLNTSPSLILARKIIELHRSIRPEIYSIIISKITNDYKSHLKSNLHTDNKKSEVVGLIRGIAPAKQNDLFFV